MHGTRYEFQPEQSLTEQPHVEAVASPKSAVVVAEATVEKMPAETAASVITATDAAPKERVAQEAVSTPTAEEAVVSPPGLSLGERLGATFGPLREKLSSGAWAYGAYVVIGVLVIAALLLPPISLLQRLGITGYTVVNAANSAISHPDGLTLSVDPATFTGKLRVRLGSVPRVDFLRSAHSQLRRAAGALPPHLEVKSPFYRIQTRGNPGQPVTIDVLIPNDAEPWETLDLYTWTGEAWEWVGGELHTHVAQHEFIRAHVTKIPANVVVMQTTAISPVVSTRLDAGDNLALAAGLVDEINSTGLLLGIDGGFVGNPAALLQPVPGDPYVVMPTLRNWAPGKAVNRGLLADVLTIPAIQQAHIANIVQLCTARGFAGVEIDYRGVLSKERTAYSDFIAALAAALHKAGLRLAVTVEPPTPTDGGWETGGYDWAAIGAAADMVNIPFPADPAAYVEGGEVHRLLAWAVGRISRHKIRMLISSLSAERVSTGVNYISLEQALAPFGNVTAVGDVSQVLPNSQVEFTLAGRILSIMPQEAAGTYRLEYTGEDGAIRTIWLGTADNLSARLNWARRYRLGGIVVDDILSPGNAPGIMDVVAAYRTGGAVAAGQVPDVAWMVTDGVATIAQANSPLNNPRYVWTASVATGTYTVNATIAGFARGSITVTVAEPPPAQPPTTMATQPPQTEPLATSPSACLNSAYVADVTIPDNTRLDNGVEFTKTWRLRNNGTCAWPADTVLAFVGGTQMDAPASVPVGAVEPGAQVDVSVRMRAPAAPGRYTGLWRTRSADGFFGMKVSVVIVAGQAPPTPIRDTGFELGGHIRDYGFPHADKMRYAGMTWAKVQIHYGQDATGIIAAAHSRGFKILLGTKGSPGLVTQPGFEQNFANWVANLARAGADAIEIWNEPNIDREWQGEHISPRAYTNLLCTAYKAIKAANPRTAVIGAGPAPTGWFSQVGGAKTTNCNDHIGCGYDDRPWLEGLYNAGAANCMDYLGAHHNAGATPPSATSGHPADRGDRHHSWYFLPQTQLYYNIFRGTRKLFYTEMGYASQEGVPPFSDAFSWARGTNNAQQAAWLAEAVRLSINTGMVRCIIIWNIDFVRYGYDPQDGYAIIRPDGSCPACEALHKVMGSR